jgi:hypothetical protein
LSKSLTLRLRFAGLCGCSFSLSCSCSSCSSCTGIAAASSSDSRRRGDWLARRFLAGDPRTLGTLLPSHPCSASMAAAGAKVRSERKDEFCNTSRHLAAGECSELLELEPDAGAALEAEVVATAGVSSGAAERRGRAMRAADAATALARAAGRAEATGFCSLPKRGGVAARSDS